MSDKPKVVRGHVGYSPDYKRDVQPETRARVRVMGKAGGQSLSDSYHHLVLMLVARTPMTTREADEFVTALEKHVLLLLKANMEAL